MSAASGPAQPTPVSGRAQAAPAKLNLGLRVVGRRADGTHELESVFVPLDLADRVEVEVAEGDAVQLELEIEREREALPGADAVPADARNLAVRAARAFLAARGRPAAVRIRLHKRIPAGAGLGGGSSDAGAVLRALVRALPDGPAGPALARLAEGLGADVPFFLDPRPAFVEGAGERITPLPGWPALGALLAHPGAPLATAEVFAELDAGGASLTPRRAGSTIPRLRALAGASPARLVEALRSEDRLRNDLEPVAVRRMPAVAELREEVEATGALATGMSGSGPVVFGLFADAAAARDAERRLRRRSGGRTWVASTLPSPKEPSRGGGSWGVAKW